MSKTFTTLAFAGLGVLLTAGHVAAQQPPSDDHVRALVAQAMNQSGQGPATQSLTPVGPTVNLSEQQAVERAAQYNLTLASERITPLTWDFSMAATRAAYAPNLTSSVGNVSRTQLSTNALQGGLRTTSEQQSWSGGVQQRLWRGGGNYNVNWTNSRDETSSSNSTCNPCFSSGLQAQFTQPLLQNRAIDDTRATIRSNEINQRIALTNLSGSEVSILAQVRHAYWELVFARQALEAAHVSLELADKLVQDNQARVEIGTMAPIDIVQAQAEQATRRQQVVTAEATLRNNELALKRLIVSGTDDDLWNATIVPVDRPEVAEHPLDLEAAVRTALSQRTDLAVTRLNLESADVTLRGIQNQTMPALNLIGQFDLTGRGGVGRPLQDPFTGELQAPPTTGYLDALRNVGTFEAPTWNVRLQFNYPLGTSAAKANLARQRLIRQQTEATLKTTELQIATEVTGAALAVRNSFEAMRASEQSRVLSEQRLSAVQSKFEVGMSTNYEVVQAQRDLNEARNSELRQQLNYQRALVDFQRVQITR
ncbi:MAG: TolC family protein [Acidobacteria bacterium]|nr:TolC family protein [Acidobacteriota bacterium]